VVRARTGGAAAATIEVTVSVAGYTLVFFVALDLFSVSIQSLLVGGAITGIVLGIALQQILGNVFAGVALLLAHPFNIGQRVMLKTGAFGGEVIGNSHTAYQDLVAELGLTLIPSYVSEPGELTFAINRKLLEGVAIVSDSDTAAAMQDAAAYLKLIVEPGGAVAFAALSTGAIPVAGRTVAVVLSGGNVDFSTYAEIMAAA